MNITISTKELLDMFDSGTMFVMDKISSIPLLQGGLFSIQGERLSIRTTNLTDFFYKEVKIGKQKEEKSFCFDLKKARDFLSFVKTKEVCVSFEEDNLIIESGKTKGVFPTIKADDFPQIPEVKGEEKRIKRNVLVSALERVGFSSSRDVSRPVLSGIYIINKDGETTFVATDGFRLSLYISKEGALNGESGIIVSSKTMFELMKITEGKEISISVDKEGKLLKFNFGDTNITTRLIEGEFPPYKKILPTKSQKTRVVTNREELINNIKTTSVFIQESSGVVFLDIKKDGIYIKPKSETDKTSGSYQEAEIEGEEQRAGFNHRYLLDFLTHLKTDRVVFEMDTPNSPGIFKGAGEDNYIHIIMPVRTD